MSPEVTAVITTHARPVAVREALRSVEAELHDDIEIVIVDDGGAFVPPSDCAVPLRVVRGTRLGVARARNLGLAAARGEFVIYLDDDDVALPHRIRTLLAAARRQRAVMCFGMTRRVVAGTAVLLDAVPTNLLAAGPVGFSELLTCAPHVNAVLVRTDARRAVGGFDVRAEHFDDWSAWLRLADREAAIGCVTETVAEWRIHSRGLTGSVLQIAAMKRRILSFFDHLERCVSAENASAVAAARRIVAMRDVATYDDYVHAVVAASASVQRRSPARSVALV